MWFLRKSGNRHNCRYHRDKNNNKCIKNCWKTCQYRLYKCWQHFCRWWLLAGLVITSNLTIQYTYWHRGHITTCIMICLNRGLGITFDKITNSFVFVRTKTAKTTLKGLYTSISSLQNCFKIWDVCSLIVKLSPTPHRHLPTLWM